jgi:hypothetical protein
LFIQPFGKRYFLYHAGDYASTAVALGQQYVDLSPRFPGKKNFSCLQWKLLVTPE